MPMIMTRVSPAQALAPPVLAVGLNREHYRQENAAPVWPGEAPLRIDPLFIHGQRRWRWFCEEARRAGQQALLYSTLRRRLTN